MEPIGAPGLDMLDPGRRPRQIIPPPGVGAGTVPAGELPPQRPPPVRIHGRPRKFWACFLLGIVSLGVYFAYWQLRVFGEVDRQEKATRWAWLWWAALAATVLAVGYVLSLRSTVLWDSLADVPAWLLATFLSARALWLGYIVLESRNLQRAGMQRGIIMPPPWLLAVLLGKSMMFSWLPVLLGWSPGVTWLGVPLDLIAFGLMQDGLNKYWRSVYDEAGRRLPRGPLSGW